MRLTVFSKDRLHRLTYQIELTESGWAIASGHTETSCDETGFPLLFQELETLTLESPADKTCLLSEVKAAMENLWQWANARPQAEAEIQIGLDRIAEWMHPYIPNPAR